MRHRCNLNPDIFYSTGHSLSFMETLEVRHYCILTFEIKKIRHIGPKVAQPGGDRARIRTQTSCRVHAINRDVLLPSQTLGLRW